MYSELTESVTQLLTALWRHVVWRHVWCWLTDLKPVTGPSSTGQGTAAPRQPGIPLQTIESCGDSITLRCGQQAIPERWRSHICFTLKIGRGNSWDERMVLWEQGMISCYVAAVSLYVTAVVIVDVPKLVSVRLSSGICVLLMSDSVVLWGFVVSPLVAPYVDLLVKASVLCTL